MQSERLFPHGWCSSLRLSFSQLFFGNESVPKPLYNLDPIIHPKWANARFVNWGLNDAVTLFTVGLLVPLKLKASELWTRKILGLQVPRNW